MNHKHFISKHTHIVLVVIINIKVISKEQEGGWCEENEKIDVIGVDDDDEGEGENHSRGIYDDYACNS